MKTAEPRAVYLKDYTPPPYRIPEITLDFQLKGKATRVAATMKVERCAASTGTPSCSLIVVFIGCRSVRSINNGAS